jgi:hypothetical protein
MFFIFMVLYLANSNLMQGKMDAGKELHGDEGNPETDSRHPDEEEGKATDKEDDMETSGEEDLGEEQMDALVKEADKMLYSPSTALGKNKSSTGISNRNQSVSSLVNNLSIKRNPAPGDPYLAGQTGMKRTARTQTDPVPGEKTKKKLKHGHLR